MSPVAGIATISKPAGITSFAALFPIKRRLGTRRVGHAGTLDRFATGLLVVLSGSYSRLSSVFTCLDKSYRAVVRFGEETDTLDPEGKVMATATPPGRAVLEAALPGFRGEIMQAPPQYSALHLGGERAYEKALRGEVVEMKPRPVVIHELELLSWDGRDAELLVRCSSGTYIRSLARDIALAAGSRARLETLSRETIGPFSLADAVSPDDFDEKRHVRSLDADLARAIGIRPAILVPSAERRFANGGVLETRDLCAVYEDFLPLPGCGTAVFSEAGGFLGVVDDKDGGYSYRFVLPEPS